MKVLVSVFNNLVTDQRVEKVCQTLSENGYEIELIGNNWGGLPEMKRNYPVSYTHLLPTFFVTNISGRSSDQSGDRKFFHVFTHVNSDECFIGIE